MHDSVYSPTENMHSNENMDFSKYQQKQCMAHGYSVATNLSPALELLCDFLLNLDTQ